MKHVLPNGQILTDNIEGKKENPSHVLSEYHLLYQHHTEDVAWYCYKELGVCYYPAIRYTIHPETFKIVGYMWKYIKVSPLSQFITYVTYDVMKEEVRKMCEVAGALEHSKEVTQGLNKSCTSLELYEDLTSFQLKCLIDKSLLNPWEEIVSKNKHLTEVYDEYKKILSNLPQLSGTSSKIHAEEFFSVYCSPTRNIGKVYLNIRLFYKYKNLPVEVFSTKFKPCELPEIVGALKMLVHRLETDSRWVTVKELS